MRIPAWVVTEVTPREDYSPFKALPFFMMARVRYGTVTWNDEIDIAPEHLYENCKAIDA